MSEQLRFPFADKGPAEPSAKDRAYAQERDKRSPRELTTSLRLADRLESPEPPNVGQRFMDLSLISDPIRMIEALDFNESLLGIDDFATMHAAALAEMALNSLGRYRGFGVSDSFGWSGFDRDGMTVVDQVDAACAALLADRFMSLALA